MKHVVEAGTDAAALLLFDRAALPEEFDARVKDVPIELFDELQAAGRVCYLEPGGDGGYLLHAYVDEPVPPALSRQAREPIVIENFAVPSGEIHFTGAEYGFRDDDSFLRKHPHMGHSFPVPPGTYRLTLYRTEYPEGELEGRFRGQVSPAEARLHGAMSGFVGLAVVSFLALAVSFLIRSREPWLGIVRPLLALFILLPWIVARLPPFRTATSRFQEMEREYPSIIAHLERV